MTSSVEDQYVNLLARCIPAATIKRNEELFLKFLECFPNPLAVKQMSRTQRAMVIEWGPEMRAVVAGIELGRLVAKSRPEICGHAYSSATLGQAMIDYFAGDEQESVVIACTDVHNDVIDYRTVFKGGKSECLLYPDQIFAYALRQSATGIVMVHNHPSGSIKPSGQDLHFAKRLERGSQLLGIQMLDFLIVGQDEYFSWREQQKRSRKVKK